MHVDAPDRSPGSNTGARSGAVVSSQGLRTRACKVQRSLDELGRFGGVIVADNDSQHDAHAGRASSGRTVHPGAAKWP